MVIGSLLEGLAWHELVFGIRIHFFDAILARLGFFRGNATVSLYLSVSENLKSLDNLK